jgi:hypothetical protein
MRKLAMVWKVVVGLVLLIGLFYRTFKKAGEAK